MNADCHGHIVKTEVEAVRLLNLPARIFFLIVKTELEAVKLLNFSAWKNCLSRLTTCGLKLLNYLTA